MWSERTDGSMSKKESAAFLFTKVLLKDLCFIWYAAFAFSDNFFAPIITTSWVYLQFEIGHFVTPMWPNNQQVTMSLQSGWIKPNCRFLLCSTFATSTGTQAIKHENKLQHQEHQMLDVDENTSMKNERNPLLCYEQTNLNQAGGRNNLLDLFVSWRAETVSLFFFPVCFNLAFMCLFLNS